MAIPPSNHHRNAPIPIGASMVALIDGGDHTTTAAESSNNYPLNPQSPGPSPCLLLPDGITVGKRIHLVGAPKTGKTSLVMDMAHSIAQSCPCRCLPHEICHCLAVTMFVMDRTTSSTTTEVEQFPIPCQSVSFSETDHGTEQGRVPAPAALSEPRFQIAALGRIEIRRIQSVKELFQYLLTIQGKPVHDQPYGAMIIDDMDRLTAGQPTTMMQTMALLSDTANFLGTLQGSTPAILVTTSSNDRLIASSIPWMTDRITIAPSLHTQSSDNDGLVGEEDVLVNTLEVHRENLLRLEGATTSSPSSVKFAVSRTKRDMTVIRWKQGNGQK